MLALGFGRSRSAAILFRRCCVLFCEMAKDSRKNHGLLCSGVKRTGEKCKGARNKSGAPVVMKKLCQHCGEQRCKEHCKCKRDRTAMAEGRHAARGQPEKRAQGGSTPSAVPAPVGRASAPTTEMLTVVDWYRRICEDISRAAEVELASYAYDNPSVQTALLKRFKSNKLFLLNVYVDEEQFGGTIPKMQKSRLRELRVAGGRVWICKGIRGLGSYHVKGIVIDRRYLYTGSGNVTAKSLDNQEWVWRIWHDVKQSVVLANKRAPTPPTDGWQAGRLVGWGVVRLVDSLGSWYMPSWLLAKQCLPVQRHCPSCHARMTGPAVHQALERLASDRVNPRHRRWLAA